MDINKYTEKAQEALLAAQRLAEQMNHPQVEPEHLLVSLVEQRDGIVPELVRKLSLEPAQILRSARELLSKLSQAFGGAQTGLSPRLKLIADLAEAEAGRLKDDYVSTEHLFLALASETGRSPGARMLTERGITPDRIL